MHRAHSIYAGVLFCAAEKSLEGVLGAWAQHSSGCGWKCSFIHSFPKKPLEL
jgi:hypothetical protein